MSDRAQRRRDEKRVQSKRKDLIINQHLTNERHLGQLKNGHGACSCVMCKPHKHGLDKGKASDLRKIQKEE